MPLGPSDVFWIGAVPSITAALAMWACVQLRARSTVAWTMSVACGLVVGMFAQNARVGWPVAFDKLLHPRVAIDWLPWLVLVAAAIQILAAYAPRTWQRWLVALACIFAIAVPLRLLANSVYVTSRWSTSEKLATLAIWSAYFTAVWLTFAVGRHNRLPLVRSGLLLVVTLGISITVAASGAITFGELGGVALATLFGTIAVAWVCNNIGDGPTTAAGPLAVMLAGLIFVGYFFSQLTATNAALLSLSLAASAGWLPFHLPLPLEEGRGEGVPRSNLIQIALRTILTLVPLVIAVVSAVSAALGNNYG